ncbi:MAG: hypothetical protein ACLGPL_00645 [Acidobacteriota bacterium]
MKTTVSLLAILLVTVFAGMAGAQNYYGGSAHTPPTQACQLSPTASNDLFDSHISLLRDGEGWPVGFQLSLENKTNQELTIAWDDTQYLRNGKENGKFMFEALPTKEATQPKEAPTTVGPGGTLAVNIWPEATLFQSGPKLGYTRNAFTRGEQGVALAVKTKDGPEVNERLAIDIAAPRCG